MEWNLATGKYGRRIVQIDDATIANRHFSDEPDEFHNLGELDFTLKFSDREFADALVNDLNEYGVGWNVKVIEPINDNDELKMFLKVKLKYRMVNGKEVGPEIYLIDGDVKELLNSASIGILQKIDIERIDLDIVPYDTNKRNEPHRTAYVKTMYVVKEEDRFSGRY